MQVAAKSDLGRVTRRTNKQRQSHQRSRRVRTNFWKFRTKLIDFWAQIMNIFLLHI